MPRHTRVARRPRLYGHTDVPPPVSGGGGGGVITPGTRDSFLWPFASASAWNTGIGAGALTSPAGIVAATNGFGNDPVYAIKSVSGDPIVNWWEPSAFAYPPGRVASMTTLHRNDLHFPSSLIIADASAGNSPNNGAIIIQPAGWAIECSALTHPTTASNIWAYAPLGGDTAIVSDLITTLGYGPTGYGHGGSGMSVLGGLIRPGELTGITPLDHCLAISLDAHLYYKRAATPSQSFRWPAAKCDSYAGDLSTAGYYNGTNPNLMPGSLLCIPAAVPIPAAVSANSKALIVWNAMVRYGAYCVEDTAWDHAQFSIDSTCASDLDATLGTLLNTYMMPNLSVVTNNAPTAIGGGGAQLQPTAPTPV